MSRKPAADRDPDPTASVAPAVRAKTSGQLRADAAKEALAKKPSGGKTAARPVKAPDNREMTVRRWAQGRSDALLTAFVSGHMQGRTMKRIPAEWMKLYQDFLKVARS